MNTKSFLRARGSSEFQMAKRVVESLTVAAALWVALGQASWSASAQNWEAAGFGAGGFFPHVAVDPADSRIVYLASDVSGLNKSTNHGDTWFKINAGLDSREVSVFAIDPSDSQRVWAGTPLGLYSSTNGGALWSLAATNILCYKHVNYRGITINHQGVMLVASHLLVGETYPPESGNLVGQLYRSMDGGKTWVRSAQLEAQFADSYRRFPAVVFDPHNDSHAYLLVEGVGMLKSTDAGSSWSYFTNSLPQGLMWKNLDVGSNVVFATAVPTLVYRSAKSSASWRLITNGISGAESTDYPNADAIRVSPADDQVVYLGQAGWPSVLYRSSNGGEDWLGSAVPEDYAFDTNNAPFQTWNNPFQALICIAIDPSYPSRVYYASWFGAWRSDNGGTNWIEKVVGSENTICTSVLADGATLYAANMDVGVYRSLDQGRTWWPCVPAPGQTDVEVQAWSLDRGAGATVYAGVTMQAIGSPAIPAVCRSDDGGVTWHIKTNGLYRPPDFDILTFVTLAAHPRQAGTLYVAVEAYTDNRAIHRSLDYGNTWTPLHHAPGSPDNPFSRRVKCIEADTVGTNRLFAGLYWDGLWYSEDGGTNWARAHGNGVDLDYASVQTTLALADGTVLAGFDNGLYRSTDHGHTFSPVLTSADWGEGSLEYVYAVAVNPADANDLFVSTAQTYPVWYNRGSVWRSSDAGTTWSNITGNLPVKPVVGLSCRDGLLYASTWGANVYRCRVDAPAAPFQIAGISRDPGGQIFLRWPSRTNQQFTLLIATNLTSAFSPAMSHIPARPPENVQAIPMTNGKCQFYRVLIEP